MPILNFEYNNSDLHLEAPDLSTGLKAALALYYPLAITDDEYAEASVLTEPLTIDSMLKLRRLFPTMRITAHYLPLQESRILDAK